MRPLAGIVDYGMGNLHSVAKAVEAAGSQVLISDSRRRLSNCEGLVVPGVGHFGAAMRRLTKMKLDGFIQSWITEDKPYLGICLGMQILFERSDEDPRTPGLGALKGKVRAFDVTKLKTKRLKIPHMGWNRLLNTWQCQRLQGIPENSFVYFVHSYYPNPEENLSQTKTSYGVRFTSAVEKGNLFASQFHPEKSSTTGLKIINNFTSLLKQRRNQS